MAGGIAFLLSAIATGFSAATVPDGPRLAFVQWSSKPAVIELRTSDAGGLESERIAGGGRRAGPWPFPLSSIAWSPDGNLVAFSGFTLDQPHRSPGSNPLGIFVVSGDGGALRAVPGTAGGMFPVFASDSRTIAFVRIRGRNSSWVTSTGKHGETFAHTSIWLANLDGGGLRRLTPWRNRVSEWPSSFSPDGATLAITQTPGHGKPRALALSLENGSYGVIAEDATEPTFSPDGSKIALIRLGDRADLYSMNSDGTNLIQLTNSPAFEAFPSWDPSGERLAFVRFRRAHTGEAVFGIGDAIMEINADGSCQTKILSSPKVAFLSPAWQPGPGREAGRINC